MKWGAAAGGAPEPPATWGPEAGAARSSHLSARAPARCPPPENGVASRPRGWQGHYGFNLHFSDDEQF